MEIAALTAEQRRLVTGPVDRRVFLDGPAGSGKTTTGVQRLRHMLCNGIPAEQILVLVPQRSLGACYYDTLHDPDLPPGGVANVMTFGGLAQRMIELFWPAFAADAGFAHPNLPPTFLTLETAQYYLARVVDPLIDDGYFEEVRVHRNRLYSQILDNLNKSAVVGFPHTTIAERLKTAWSGKTGQLEIYDQAQDCAERFRSYCYENNLLDYSLQIEVFCRHLWPSMLVRAYLTGTYRHLIYDNVEEDVPMAHDIVRAWLPDFDSALLIFDQEGGFRSYLGADVESAECLKQDCDEVVTFEKSWTSPPAMKRLERLLVGRILREPTPAPTAEDQELVHVHQGRFYPHMIADTCACVQEQIANGCRPEEVVILAPFVSDALRFSLHSELERLGVQSSVHRPSRSLRTDPVTRCLITLARLAHPHWEFPPEHALTLLDVREALMQVIDGIDFLRAHLLAEVLFNRTTASLRSFDPIHLNMRERIGYRFGERYEVLRQWLEGYTSEQPVSLDVFLSRLFGEVLSQPEFTFHRSYSSAASAARLIESVQKFRRAVEHTLPDDQSIGREYILTVARGLIGATHLVEWRDPQPDAVLISPAHTFLAANRTARLMCLLDVGSTGWWQRLDQPLTQPHVLSRRWPPGVKWTDGDEYESNQRTLARLVRGLIRRCSGEIHLFAVSVNESGVEERGPLLQSLQGLLRQINRSDEVVYG